MLRSYINYRKQDLLSKTWNVNICEGIEIYFETLRYDLFQAVKLPSLLFEDNNVGASAAYEIARRVDEREMKFVFDNIIRYCKDNFIRQMFAEATVSSEDPALAKFKHELIYGKNGIKERIAQLRSEIETILRGSREGDPVDDTTPADDLSAPSGPSSGSVSGSSSGSSSGPHPTTHSIINHSHSGSRTVSSPSPSSNSGSYAHSTSTDDVDVNSPYGYAAKHYNNGPYGGSIDASNAVGSSPVRDPKARPTYKDGDETWTPAPLGTFTPYDNSWWNGLKRVGKGLFRRLTRPFRRDWHRDEERPMSKEHANVIGGMMSEYAVSINRILNENTTNLLKIIDDFEKNLIMYVVSNIDKFYKSMGGTGTVASASSAIDADPAKEGDPALAGSGSSVDMPTDPRANNSPARATAPQKEKAAAGLDPNSLSGNKERAASKGDRNALQEYQESAKNLIEGGKFFGFNIKLSKNRDLTNVLGGDVFHLQARPSKITLNGEDLKFKSFTYLLKYVYNDLYKKMHGPNVKFGHVAHERLHNLSRDKSKNVLSPKIGQYVIDDVNKLLGLQNFAPKQEHFLKVLMTVGYLVRKGHMQSNGNIDPNVVNQAIASGEGIAGVTKPLMNYQDIVDQQSSEMDDEPDSTEPLPQGQKSVAKIDNKGKPVDMSKDPRSGEPIVGSPPVTDDYPSDPLKFAEKLSSEHPEMVEKFLQKFNVDHLKGDERMNWLANSLKTSMERNKATPEQIVDKLISVFGEKTPPNAPAGTEKPAATGGEEPVGSEEPVATSGEEPAGDTSSEDEYDDALSGEPEPDFEKSSGGPSIRQQLADRDTEQGNVLLATFDKLGITDEELDSLGITNINSDDDINKIGNFVRKKIREQGAKDAGQTTTNKPVAGQTTTGNNARTQSGDFNEKDLPEYFAYVGDKEKLTELANSGKIHPRNIESISKFLALWKHYKDNKNIVIDHGGRDVTSNDQVLSIAKKLKELGFNENPEDFVKPRGAINNKPKIKKKTLKPTPVEPQSAEPTPVEPQSAEPTPVEPQFKADLSDLLNKYYSNKGGLPKSTNMEELIDLTNKFDRNMDQDAKNRLEAIDPDLLQFLRGWLKKRKGPSQSGNVNKLTGKQAIDTMRSKGSEAFNLIDELEKIYKRVGTEEQAENIVSEIDVELADKLNSDPSFTYENVLKRLHDELIKAKNIIKRDQEPKPEPKSGIDLSKLVGDQEKEISQEEKTSGKKKDKSRSERRKNRNANNGGRKKRRNRNEDDEGERLFRGSRARDYEDDDISDENESTDNVVRSFSKGLDTIIFNKLHERVELPKTRQRLLFV